MSRKLTVYLRHQKIGCLEQDANAELSFTYDEAYLNTGSAQAISVSMPIADMTYQNPVVKPYFSGLLPDESARTRLGAALGISDTNAFGMLEIIGGDCAGALALHPEGQHLPESSAEDEILSTQQLAELLLELRGNPLLGGRRDVRLSLAGAQDKIAVKLSADHVALVKNGEPTTHILKPAIQGLEGTAQNEAFCMSLASRLGLNTPAVQCARAGDTDYVLVERFDRKVYENHVERLHQEDFCQALSVPPELKYEDEGGPGVIQSLALLQKVVARPVADKLTFLRMLMFHFLVGNADAHAKNFALLYPIDAKMPSLAPVYDVVCTAAYPQLTKNMAMRIGDRNLPDTIQYKHWLAVLPENKASERLLRKELMELSESIVPAAQQLLAEARELDFYHPVLKAIVKIINKRAKLVLKSIA